MAQLRLVSIALSSALFLVACSDKPNWRAGAKSSDYLYGEASEGAGANADQTVQPPFGETAASANTGLINNGGTVKVGLLLPLSGSSQMIGNALRDAAVMALFDKYATMPSGSAQVKVELVTKDTKGTPEGAREAATAAVKDGATLLLGPLFSRSVEAIKPLAKTGKVTILSFSNNKEVAGNGVYLMGFDPAEQATRVANYAYRNDVNTVAALAPNNAYGREVLGGFDGVATLLGRKLEPVVRYSEAGASLNHDIRTLAKQGTTGARFNFGALLLPEAGNKLGPILGGLEAANISPKTVQFIGTGLWDDKRLIANHDLNGAWLASAPPEQYEAFEQRFKNSYGSKPPRLASLSYDAVALAATLANQPGGISRSAIVNRSGYYGPANGIFRFQAGGTIERGLAVLEVMDGSFKVIDPAPKSFR